MDMPKVIGTLSLVFMMIVMVMTFGAIGLLIGPLVQMLVNLGVWALMGRKLFKINFTGLLFGAGFWPEREVKA